MKHLLTLITIFCLAACGEKRSQVDIVIVDNNIEIPIDGCIEAQKKIMGNSVDATSFCKCLIPKMYSEFKSDPEKLKLLKEGKIDQVSKDKIDLVAKFYSDCISQSSTNDSTTRMTISPKMGEQIKQEMKRNLIGTDIDRTNDIDQYCDCLINGMRTEFTAKEIMQEDFNQSEKYQTLGKRCLQSTLKR